MTDGTQWINLRISVQEERQSSVLSYSVGPFLRQVPGRGFFIPDPGNSVIDLYFEAPSHLSPQALAAPLLASLEGPLGQATETRIAVGKRTGIHEVQMAGAAAQNLVEEFLSETSPFVIELIDRARAGALARVALAFDLMAIQPFVLREHLFERLRGLSFPCAFVSYRSHVDGFLIATRDPEAALRSFDERYRRNEARLRGRVEELRRQLEDHGPPTSASAAEWARLLAKYVGPVLRGLRSGEFVVTSDTEHAGQHLGDHFDLGISPFHRAVYRDHALRAAAPTDVEFNAMRIMASLLYLTLHQMGVRLIERYLVCYSVCRAFEDQFAVSAEEAITQFSRLLVGSARAAAEGP